MNMITCHQWHHRMIVVLTVFFLIFPCVLYAEEIDIRTDMNMPFILGVETSFENPVFSWVLTQDGGIVKTQAQRFFQYTFQQVGIFKLTMTAHSGTSEELRTFLIKSEVPVSVSGSDQSFVRAVLRTNPIASENTVTLPGRGGSLLLHLNESTGDIREYHVDTNLNIDTNGDGNPANDADNRYHPSFHEGGSFPISLVPAPNESERVLQLRVYGTHGEVSEVRIRVQFDPAMQPVPVLTTFPIFASKNGMILPEEGGIIQLDASKSYGGVTAYTLDTNEEIDSNGNDNTHDDNDVVGTPFARYGTTITFFLLPKGKSTRNITLTVRNADGVEASLTHVVRFAGTGIPLLPTSPQDISGIEADSAVLTVGTSFTLSINEPNPNTVIFVWDLQSDGVVDARTNEPSLLLEPDAPGVLPVRVQMLDATGNILDTLNDTFTVHTAPPSVDQEQEDVTSNVPQIERKALRIDVTTTDLRAQFKPVIGAAYDLTLLVPLWSFGDGATSYLLTPDHEYAKAGTFNVELTLHDMVSGREIVSATTKVTVRGSVTPPSSDDVGVMNTILGFFGFIFKIAIFIFILLLIITGILFVVLLMQAKQEHIELKELIQRYKHSLKGEDAPEKKKEETVPEIIDSKPVSVDKVKEEPLPTEPSDEPPPMKLKKEDVVSDSKPKIPTSTSDKTEFIPPWLQQQEASPPEISSIQKKIITPPKSEPPKPLEPTQSTEPSKPKSSEPIKTTLPKPSSVQKQEHVPDWLAEGMQKSEKSEDAKKGIIVPVEQNPIDQTSKTSVEQKIQKDKVSEPAIKPNSIPTPVKNEESEKVKEVKKMEEKSNTLEGLRGKEDSKELNKMEKMEKTEITTDDEPIAIIKAEVGEEEKSQKQEDVQKKSEIENNQE